jgi:hypothetical protein
VQTPVQVQFHALSGATIDGNVIKGVSVITVGEAKGHDFYIDPKTLETYLSAASARPNGVRVKVEHESGFESIAGALRDFRIDGDSLRADLHLLTEYEDFSRIVEMAKTMPEEIGLSASGLVHVDKIGGNSCVRCDELHSVDLVDRPAANPNGLFKEGVDSPAKGMAEKFDSFVAGLKNLVGVSENADLKAATDKVTDLSAKIVTFEADLKAANEKATKLEADLKAAQKEVSELPAKVELAASEKAKQIMASLGQPPVISTPTVTPAAPVAPDLSKLSPRERVIAAFKAQTAQKANLIAK